MVRDPTDNSDVFSSRLELALGGESPHAFSRRSGIRDSLLRKYLAGSVPGVDKAAALARALGVRLEWLATGEQPMRHAPPSEQSLQLGPMRMTQGGPPALDEALLRDVIIAVETVLKERGINLSAPKKADLVVAFYELQVGETEGERRPVERRQLLRLVDLAS